MAALPADDPNLDHARLESLFIAEGLGQLRPAVLALLMKSSVGQYRAAAVHLLRLQADRLPDAQALLTAMAADPHPRVRMEVIDAVAHLRAKFPQLESALTSINATHPTLKRMMNDLSYGTKPRLSASVPVLEIAPETRLTQWQDAGSGLYRTFVNATAASFATLAVNYSFLEVSLNGIQVFTAASQWSSDHQVQLEFTPGLNVLELSFKKLNGGPPAVHLFDAAGQRLGAVSIPQDRAQFAPLLAEFQKMTAAHGLALRVQAVADLKFAPTELRAPAGTKLHLIFDNPDLMIHNFVLCAPGSEDEIGAMADQLAATPEGLTKQYVPNSPKVLQHTALVAPKTRAELTFDAPMTPGRYPYLCTFPGHWRIMKGVLIIEQPSANEILKSAGQDGFESSARKCSRASQRRGGGALRFQRW